MADFRKISFAQYTFPFPRQSRIHSQIFSPSTPRQSSLEHRHFRLETNARLIVHFLHGRHSDLTPFADRMRSRQVINDKGEGVSKENEGQRSRFSTYEVSRSLDFHALVSRLSRIEMSFREEALRFFFYFFFFIKRHEHIVLLMRFPSVTKEKPTITFAFTFHINFTPPAL